MNSQPLPKSERYEEIIKVLKPDQKILFSRKILDNNNALYYNLQIGERSFEEQAKSSLIASIVESDFYTQMRTNQQLGYIVWSFNSRVEDRLFFKMIIQSAGFSPFELRKRVEAWMAKTQKLFDNLSDEEFENHRKSLIVSLEKKGDSIGEVAQEIFYLATEEKGDFDYKNKLIKAVKNIKKENVLDAGRKLFQNSSTPRSIILIRSRSNDEKVPEGVLTNVVKIKTR